MARFSRLEVLNRIDEVGLVPVFYHGDLEVASQVVAACAAGGVTVFEFTNRGDHAIDVFQALARQAAQRAPALILGAGSIVDEATAALFVAHGANFIVGPSFNERVARFCNRRKIAYLPGCATATEIATAEEAGVEIVKLFPCELVGGAEFVKALLGPCPWTRLMPTGIREVTKAGLAEWFKAGIVAAGIGRELLKKEFIEKRDYTAITRRAAEIRQWIQEARGR
jgi:2-dehydro-3-deoxyphosphogluconate aldolase / (4S)-4-hydroxy-2-oxoglutarate aldolase